MTSVAKAGGARWDKKIGDEGQLVVGSDDNIPCEWIELVAYQKWEESGKSHGHDVQDWLESEQQLRTLLQAARLEPNKNQNDQRWVTLLQSLPRDMALNALQKLVGQNGSAFGRRAFRIFDPDEKGHDAPEKADSGGTSMDSSKKSNKEEEEGAVAMDKLRARRNRDALTLMSEEDRTRYASRYAVIARSGNCPGRVIAEGQSIDEAAEKARRVPGYRPIDYSIRYVIPPDEPLLENSRLP